MEENMKNKIIVSMLAIMSVLAVSCGNPNEQSGKPLDEEVQ